MVTPNAVANAPAAAISPLDSVLVSTAAADLALLASAQFDSIASAISATTLVKDLISWSLVCLWLWSECER